MSVSTIANETQVGGAHYKADAEMLERADAEMLERAKAVGLNRVPEPWDIAFIRGHDNFQTAIHKYTDRFRSKNGLEDLYKARHYLDKLIETEENRKTLQLEAEAAAAVAPKSKKSKA